ncbi:hypothetical protein KUV89_17675 [Marinobacter hydrocarbonoclasticus]|nr:hypothetical protein [Marinobacter nauticus]
MGFGAIRCARLKTATLNKKPVIDRLFLWARDDQAEADVLHGFASLLRQVLVPGRQKMALFPSWLLVLPIVESCGDESSVRIIGLRKGLWRVFDKNGKNRLLMRAFNGQIDLRQGRQITFMLPLSKKNAEAKKPLVNW